MNQTGNQLSRLVRDLQAGSVPLQPGAAAGDGKCKGKVASSLGDGMYSVDLVSDSGSVIRSLGAVASFPRNTGLSVGDDVRLEYRFGPNGPPTIASGSGGGGGGDSVVAVEIYRGMPEGA